MKKTKLNYNKFLFLIQSIIAIAIVVLLFIKTIVDVDRAFDNWWYHFPFAARIWNIIPPEIYVFESVTEERYKGFPLLGEFLQGFFWRVFQHVQATNLVCFFSLITYLFFLKTYFKIPLYLSTIALLAVPLIQVHTASSYVDLPSNVCLSILILLTYLSYIKKDFFNPRNLLIIVLAAAGAANTKFQLIPLTGFVLLFTASRWLWLNYQSLVNRPTRLIPVTLLATVLATCLIFAVPIKNTILYQQPFYPRQAKLQYVFSNQVENPFKVEDPSRITQTSEQQQSQRSLGFEQVQKKFNKWAISLFEIRKAPWSIGQWSEKPYLNRLGGFFGIYVVFHLGLLGYLFISWRERETTVAVIVVILATVFFIMPLSYELRYYLYWMMVLISLNLFLVIRQERLPGRRRLISTNFVSLVCLATLILVMLLTKGRLIRPRFYSLNEHIQKNVESSILQQIEAGDRVCIIGQRPHTFIYASPFHPKIEGSYSVQAAFFSDECKYSERIGQELPLE